MEFIIKGFTIGFLVAAPVGPIGILCIKRSLTKGRKSGLITGIGAATADTLYGCIAAFGMTTASNLLLTYKDIFQFIGIFFLLYLGVKSFFKESNEATIAIDRNNKIFKDYISTFFLTVTNPSTILSFIAIFAGIGVLPKDTFTVFSLVSGVFLGSSFWWLFLSFTASKVGNKIGSKQLTLINKISGVVLILFSTFFFYNLVI
ncbi:LysE family transporter [Fusobacteria bacterium ZRK30]|nr:LysE family transporter [Fusobacteria bacterium ZRK30]